MNLKLSQTEYDAPVAGKSHEYSTPDRKAQVRGSPGETPSCTLMSPGACKIPRERNVLQIPIQIIPLGVPKRERHPLRGESKLRRHVSGSSFGINPRPSAIAH